MPRKNKTTEEKLLQVANLSPDEDWIEKIVDVHPMKQVAVMSVIQVLMLATVGAGMFFIGLNY